MFCQSNIVPITKQYPIWFHRCHCKVEIFVKQINYINKPLTNWYTNIDE